MTPEDFNTMFQLVLGLLWGTVMLILWRRNRSKPELWPGMFGVGGGLFIFLLLMVQSILRWPKSEFIRDTIANLLLALAFGIVCYFSGRKLARDSEKKRKT